ncbi:hypothetical protein AB0B27_14335 [Micromonospora rifamycinica]|uniref:hypothetical protein n=1 Tax=Micromonospora rifamycinica TaxID=291594 RepID=UPI0033F47A56
MKQHTADGGMLGAGTWSLVPPGSDDFTVYGGSDTVKRAREWALRHQVLLYRGPAQACVHGLYRMDSCTFSACTSVGLDHTQIWVQHDGRGAFLLTHPYDDEVPESLRVYADMHGLRVDSYPSDGWYGHGTLPIRLTIPDSWPLWPIERDAVLLLHTQPVTWPDDDVDE